MNSTHHLPSTSSSQHANKLHSYKTSFENKSPQLNQIKRNQSVSAKNPLKLKLRKVSLNNKPSFSFTPLSNGVNVIQKQQHIESIKKLYLNKTNNN